MVIPIDKWAGGLYILVPRATKQRKPGWAK